MHQIHDDLFYLQKRPTHTHTHAHCWVYTKVVYNVQAHVYQAHVYQALSKKDEENKTHTPHTMWTCCLHRTWKNATETCLVKGRKLIEKNSIDYSRSRGRRLDHLNVVVIVVNAKGEDKMQTFRDYAAATDTQSCVCARAYKFASFTDTQTRTPTHTKLSSGGRQLRWNCERNWQTCLQTEMNEKRTRRMLMDRKK